MSDTRRSLCSNDDIEFAVRRIDELEAKLAKAVETLEKIDREYAEQGGWCGTAHATLAELKGEDR